MQLMLNGFSQEITDKFFDRPGENKESAKAPPLIKTNREKCSEGDLRQIKILKQIIDNRNNNIKSLCGSLEKSFPSLPKKLNALLIKTTNDKTIDSILEQSKIERIIKLKKSSNRYLREHNSALTKRNVFQNYGKWYLLPSQYKKPKEC